MRQILHTMLALTLVLGFTACRSKERLTLLRPGEAEAWRTVSTLESEREVLPRVELVTNFGVIVIELFERQAPVTVANFLRYVDDGFYAGTIFHRVESGLVIQGGGFTVDMQSKPTRAPIINEAGNRLSNTRGTVGIARTTQMNSATSQFYVNLANNTFFDGDGINDGYAVFGRIYDGMDVVDRIARSDTQTVPPMANVPVLPVVIESARRL